MASTNTSNNRTILNTFRSKHVSFLSTFPFDDARITTHFMHHPSSKNLSCAVCKPLALESNSAPQPTTTAPQNDKPGLIPIPKPVLAHPTINSPCAFTISMLQGETLTFYGAIRLFVHAGQISYANYTTKPIRSTARCQQYIKTVPNVCPSLAVNMSELINISNPTWFADSVFQITSTTDSTFTIFPSTTSLELANNWDPLEINMNNLDGIDMTRYLHAEAQNEASMITHVLTQLYSYYVSPFDPKTPQYTQQLLNLCTILSTLPIAPQSIRSFISSQLPHPPSSDPGQPASTTQLLTNTTPYLTTDLANHHFHFRMRQITQYLNSPLFRYPLATFTPILCSRFPEQSGKMRNFSITACGYKWQQSIDFITSYIHSYYFPMIDLSSFITNTDNISFKPPTIMVCGPRNYGKSSFVRFLVNKYLSKYPMVAHFETDIGQTESSPPGVVSITLLHSPIMAPPFENLQWNSNFSTIVGSTSLSDCAGRYTAAIQTTHRNFLSWYALNALAPNAQFQPPNSNNIQSNGQPTNSNSNSNSNKSKSENNSNNNHNSQPQRLLIPLIVNTCGWTTGLGKSLIARIAGITRPDIIVEMADKPALTILQNQMNVPIELPPIQPSLSPFSTASNQQQQQQQQSNSNQYGPKVKPWSIKRGGQVQMGGILKVVDDLNQFIDTKARANLLYFSNIQRSSSLLLPWILNEEYPLTITPGDTTGQSEQLKSRQQQQLSSDNQASAPDHTSQRSQLSTGTEFTLHNCTSDEDFSIFRDEYSAVGPNGPDSTDLALSTLHPDKRGRFGSKPMMCLKFLPTRRKLHFDPSDFVQSTFNTILHRSRGEKYENVSDAPPGTLDVNDSNSNEILAQIRNFPTSTLDPYVSVLTKWSDDFVPLCDVDIIEANSQSNQSMTSAPPTNPILSIFGCTVQFTLPQHLIDSKMPQIPLQFTLSQFDQISSPLPLFCLASLPPLPIPQTVSQQTQNILPNLSCLSETTLSNAQLRHFSLLKYFLAESKYSDSYPFADSNTASDLTTQPPKHISHVTIPIPGPSLKYPKISLTNAGELLNACPPIYEIPCTALKIYDVQDFNLQTKTALHTNFGQSRERIVNDELMQQLAVSVVGLTSVHPYFSSLGLGLIRGYKHVPDPHQPRDNHHTQSNHHPSPPTTSKNTVVLLISTPIPPDLLKFVDILLVLSQSLSQLPPQLLYNPRATLPQPFVHPIINQQRNCNTDVPTSDDNTSTAAPSRNRQQVIGKNQMRNNQHLQRHGQQQ